MPTKYELHKQKWSSCEKCELCRHRKRVVLFRGRLPCDLLFIGEAPGAGEDVIGSPFVGPAGKLLDKMIARALEQSGLQHSFKLGFTNIVACIPKTDELEKNYEPPLEAINACTPRLKEIIEIASPQAAICVGKLATKYVGLNFPDIEHVYSIVHPAAILRADITQKGLFIQEVIVKLTGVFEDAAEFPPF